MCTVRWPCLAILAEQSPARRGCHPLAAWVAVGQTYESCSNASHRSRVSADCSGSSLSGRFPALEGATAGMSRQLGWPVTPRTLILGTAGHIDHGKTALLRALTGIDTDRLPEEKQRGITIDIGFANLEIGPYQLGIVDVPGHERFIKNMLAGAVGIDVALLVIAADDSVMPQTREHLAILQLLQIRHGVIVVTKCDRVEQVWIELIEDDIRKLVVGTFLEDAPVVRTAVPPSGPPQGLSELCGAIRTVCDQVVEQEESQIFRMPVDRSFTVPGIGTVVTGTIWSGQVRRHDQIQWLPRGERVTTRGLQNHGRDAEVVVRGQRAAINLAGVQHQDIVRGHELATPGYLSPAKLLTVELQLLSACPWRLKHRSRQRLYLGTQEILVTISLLEQAAIEPGESGLAQLHCSSPTVATAGQPFVIRAESPLVTIGGGRVLQTRAARLTRRRGSRIDRLRALSSQDDNERAVTAIYFYGTEKWTNLDLCRDAQLNVARCPKLVEALLQAGTVVELTMKQRPVGRVHRDILAEREMQLLTRVEQLHAQAPLHSSIPRDQLVSAIRGVDDSHITNAVIDRLIADGRLRGDQASVASTDFGPQLSHAQRQLRQVILFELQSAGLSPPDIKQLCQVATASEKDVREILDHCVSEGRIVRLRDGLYLDQGVEVSMRTCLSEALQQSTGLTQSEIRDLLGTTRKFSVPICEYLDRIGFTIRKGDLRVMR